MSGSPISKRALILALALPVAAFLGYLLAGPLDYTSIAVYSAVLGIILIPVMFHYHHALLVVSLNMMVDIFFLPGRPHLWMLLALLSLGMTVVSKILDKETKLIFVPSVTVTLLLLMVVVAMTAKLTGGLVMRVLGVSTYGGRRYVYLAFAFVVFLAVSMHRVPQEKARLYVGLYFLSTLTTVASNLIYMAGPGLWWLYLFFPVDFAMTQAYEDFSFTVGTKIGRLGGFAPAATAIVCFTLCLGGIRGLWDMRKPWRLLLVLGTMAVGLFSGFRSGVVFIAAILMIQFCLEGLLKTRLFLALLLGGILGFAALVPMVQKLPLSVQRSLSILPLDVDSAVRADARNSTDWRLQMWQVLVPQIPRYFWLGKGCSATETDFYLATESAKRGLARDYELCLMAGDYHNGPLSVILPFGIWGVLGFLAFLVAATRVMYLNYRHGPPVLKRINTLLFAYYLAKLVFFFTIFGQLHTDLGMLAALVGLSVSLNGGVARAAAAVPAKVAASSPTPARWRPARA